MKSDGFENNHAGAVARMFELVRNGATDDQEFAMLDAAILAGLSATYGADNEAPPLAPVLS